MSDSSRPSSLERVLTVCCPALCRPGSRFLKEWLGAGGARLDSSLTPAWQEQLALEELRAALRELSPAIRSLAPGVFSMPSRAGARYFGGEEALARALLEGGRRRLATLAMGAGAADGLLAACLAAFASLYGPPGTPEDHGATLVIAPGQTPAFLAEWPVEIIGDEDVCALLAALGIRTLGDLAALPGESVRTRFGETIWLWHQAALGLDCELPPGLLDASSSSRSRLKNGARRHAGDADMPRAAGTPASQPGFWGEEEEATLRMAGVAAAIRRILGPGAVSLATLGGGRSPSERGRMVVWAGHMPPPLSPPDPRPWPGHLPKPSPARVLVPPLPAELVDSSGRRLQVSSRGLLRGSPALVSLGSSPWKPVAGFAGPWPADERWWSPARRRRARLQVLTTEGDAHLLVVEQGRWYWEGAYD